MRKLACSGLFIIAAVSAASAAEPIGEWRVEDGVATIKIVECNTRLWGVVATEQIPGGTDQNNPDKAKRNRPTLGMPILLNMAKDPSEKAKWEGQIYNGKNGKTYDASIQLKSPNVLAVEGCVMSVLCGGQKWTRVPEPVNPASAANPTSPTTGSTRPMPPATPHGTAKAPAPRSLTAQAPKAAPMAPGATAANEPPAESEICLLPEIAGLPH